MCGQPQSQGVSQATSADIGGEDFFDCINLTSVTIGNGVTNVEEGAFSGCSSLTSVYFEGNAPTVGSLAFKSDTKATVYYLPGTTGWTDFDAESGLRAAVLWNPQVQSGSVGVRTNQPGFNITGTSNLVVVIETSTNLANPTWLPLQTNTLNASSLYFTDPNWTNYPSRFYRVTWP